MTEPERAQPVRRTIHYSGYVQGVGFRHQTRQLAANFAVAGFVQNLPDGRVLLVVEGAAGEVERFVGRLESQLERNIRGRQQSQEPSRSEFADFTIKH